jgi:hypothetical protein
MFVKEEVKLFVPVMILIVILSFTGGVFADGVDDFETHNWHSTGWGDQSTVTYTTVWKSQGSTSLKLDNTSTGNGWTCFQSGCFDAETWTSIKMDLRNGSNVSQRIKMEVIDQVGGVHELGRMTLSANTTYYNVSFNNSYSIRNLRIVLDSYGTNLITTYIDNIRIMSGSEVLWDPCEFHYYWESVDDAWNGDPFIYRSEDITHSIYSANNGSTASITLEWNDPNVSSATTAGIETNSVNLVYSDDLFFTLDVYRPVATPDVDIKIIISDGVNTTETSTVNASSADQWTQLTAPLASPGSLTNITKIKLVVLNTDIYISGKLYFDNLKIERTSESPTNLNASVVSGNQIDLSWTDNANNEDGFSIERKADNETYSFLADVGQSITSYSDAGLDETKTYTYRVLAFNSGGNSAYSNEASAKTLNTYLFENSYHVWELMRNSAGLYRDSKKFDGNDDHPCSIANVGVGLIALCIADAMVWEADAAGKAITTLQTVLSLERNVQGFFHHWYLMDSPHQPAWDESYSTIDTDIMIIGALFCKNYFSANSTIAELVDKIFNSIDFTAVIADLNSGEIYLELNSDYNKDGNITSGGYTRVYNEYMISAWLAIHDNNNNTQDAQTFWDMWYNNPVTSSLPISDYWGIKVLSDDWYQPPLPNEKVDWLSSFTHQFIYYYCDYFNTTYMADYKRAQKADSLYWFNVNNMPEYTVENYEWGCGAGVDPVGYHPDAIENNQYQIVSPHIIAGFIPIDNESIFDLDSLYCNNKGIRSFVEDNYSRKIIWRYSLADPSWLSPSVQGVDFATMLYGLASLDEFLGPDFFDTYNNITCSSQVPPGAPTGLRATAASNNQIDLVWMDNITNEDGFRIERSDDGETNWTELEPVSANITGYSNAGLNPSTIYYYRVFAYNSFGNSNYSSIAAPPVAPGNLSAVPVPPDSIDLIWEDNSNNEIEFIIERSEDGGVNWTQIAVNDSNTTGYSEGGLNPSTTYTYRIRARNDRGDSEYSNTVSTNPSLTMPEAPSNLVATAVAFDQINLSWTDNSSNEIEFKLMRSDDGGINWTLIDVVDANVTECLNKELDSLSTYYYKVRACNSMGDSDYSNTATAATPFGIHTEAEDWDYVIDVGGVPAVDTLPCSEGGLYVTSIDPGDWMSYEVNIPDSTFYTVEYRVSCSATGQSFKLDSNIGGNVKVFDIVTVPNTGGGQLWTTVTDTIILDDGSYGLGISSIGGGWNINHFRIAEFNGTPPAPPTAPTNLIAEPVSTTQINLSWTDNSDNTIEFVIERSPDGNNGWSEITRTDRNITTYLDTGLDANVTYYYRVYTRSSSGRSIESNTSSATTLFQLMIEAEDWTYVNKVGGVATVDTLPCSEGGLYVTSIDPGDWMSYEVNIPHTGYYTVEYRLASPQNYGCFKFDMNSGSIILDDNVIVPNTGDDQNWTWTTVSHIIEIPAGQGHIGIFAYTGGWNINYFRLTEYNSTPPPSWIVLTYDDFESGWGNYTPGSTGSKADCILYTWNGTGDNYAYQGNCAAEIRDNRNPGSSFFYTQGIDVASPDYTQIQVEFWFYAKSMDNSSEDFWVQYYDGSSWYTVAAYADTIDFINDQFYFRRVLIDESSYSFSTNMKLRFMCDASGNKDHVYIDKICVSARGNFSKAIPGGNEIMSESEIIPSLFGLDQNYPNPFNPTTTIQYSLPEQSFVTLKVYNIRGEEVAALVETEQPAGQYHVIFDASEFHSGIYFYSLRAGGYKEVKRMVFIK